MVKKAKQKGLMKNVARLVKGEPLNMEERMDLLEEEMSTKIRQMEESMALFREVVFRLYNENVELKKRSALMTSMSAKAALVKDDINEKIVKPILNEGKDFVNLVLEDGGQPIGQNDMLVEEEPVEEKEIPRSQKIKVEPVPEETEATTNPAEADLRPELRTEPSREKTIQWMRQKFGLSVEQSVRKSKTVVMKKSRKSKKAKVVKF